MFRHGGLSSVSRIMWISGGCIAVWLALFVSGLAADNLSVLAPETDRPNHDLNRKNVKVVNGAMSQKAWRLAPENGRLAFTVRCDPERQNYVTLRFWSEDEGASFHLYDTDGERVSGFDHPTSSEIAPSQWYYTTKPLPPELTEGRESVRLHLKTNKGTRNLYEITSHTEARFQPGDHVPETEAVEPYAYGPYEPGAQTDIGAEKWAELQEQWAAWRRKGADKTAEYIMSKQWYRPDWRQRVEDAGYEDGPGEYMIRDNDDRWPGPMVGGFDIQWGTNESLSKTMHRQGKFIKKRDNGGPMRGVAVLAMAYTLEGGKYEGDPEVLDRIAVALDFMRRAQGKNGGFVDVHGGWVGGPNRGKGEGVLEGRMHRAAATAVRLTYEDLKKEGLLEERVDDDADPGTPPVPRRKVMQDLLHNSLSYLLKQRGHAPNQEMMNVRALAPLHQALERVGGYDALDASTLQKKMRERIAQITGLKPYGSPHSQQEYWVSPKGISMEIGGMSFANYGVLTGAIGALADLTGDERIHRRGVIAAEALSYFWYPVYHEDERIDVRQQEAISTRGILVRGGDPAVSQWAILNGVESHIRARQLQVMQGDDRPGHLESPEGDPPAITGYDPHGWNSSVGILRRAKEQSNKLQVFQKLRDTEGVRLPHEKGQPDFAWVDPISGAVAVKHGEQHVFMTLNSLDGRDTDRAEVLEVSPNAQRWSTIDIDTPHGVHELTRVKYGSLLLIVNASKEKAYSVNLPEGDGETLDDLVSGQTLKAGTSQTLKPGESMAVYTR